MAEKKTYSFQEPAERPLSIALSAEELVELAKCHQRRAARIDKLLAKEVKECKTQRELKALVEEAKKWHEAHLKRASGLYLLAEEHLKDS